MKKLKLLFVMLLLWGYGKAATPTLLYPLNSIDTQAVKLQFAFHPAATMQFYDVQVDTTPQFNSILLKDSIGIVDFSMLNANDTIIKTIYSLYYGTKQYWRVRGRNATDTTDWSEVRSFTTRNFPLVITPSNNYFFPTLAGASTLWKNIGGSTSYEVQVGSTTVFISPIYIYNVTSITHDYPHMWNISISFFGMPAASDYYLRIKAYNEVDSSEWSPELHFNIIDQTSLSESKLCAFSIFPNPSKEYLNILSNGNNQLRIFDIEGKEVFQTQISSISQQIDISALSQGTYFLQIRTDEKLLIQKLLVTE